MMRPFRGFQSILWAPLIDGTYAIVLTLLVIELPDLAMEQIRIFNHDQIGIGSLAISLAHLISGYLAVFLVIFDIWMKKRRLLSVSESFSDVSGLENSVILISLFLATLLPPFHYLLWQVRQEYFIEGMIKRSVTVEASEVRIIEIFFGMTAVLIYIMILLAANRRSQMLRAEIAKHEPGERQRRLIRNCANLKALRKDTILRIVIAPLLYTPWLRPLPILAYGISGLWHTNQATQQNPDEESSVKCS
jgi:uncharacterized membrane protein